MKIEIWPKFGPLNSNKIFDCFIQSLHDSGEQLFVDQNAEADVAVIWSVLWQGRMRNYQRIWQQYRSAGKPVIVLEVGGLRRNESFKIGINGVNAKADFANETFDDKRWPLFRHTFKPWKDTGNKIIILGQHHTSEQWAGMPSMDKWFENQILCKKLHCRLHHSRFYSSATDKGTAGTQAQYRARSADYLTSPSRNKQSCFDVYSQD